MQEEVGRSRNRNWKYNQNISEIISISSITSINKAIFSRSVSPEMYHKQLKSISDVNYVSFLKKNKSYVKRGGESKGQTCISSNTMS